MPRLPAAHLLNPDDRSLRARHGRAAPRWSADVRLEVVAQKQPRTGTTNIDASAVTGEEATERDTKDLDVATMLRDGIGNDWSISLRVPVVKRDHLHDLIDEGTAQLPRRNKGASQSSVDMSAVVMVGAGHASSFTRRSRGRPTRGSTVSSWSRTVLCCWLDA